MKCPIHHRLRSSLVALAWISCGRLAARTGLVHTGRAGACFRGSNVASPLRGAHPLVRLFASMQDRRIVLGSQARSL
jgi:hypothetical protein